MLYLCIYLTKLQFNNFLHVRKKYSYNTIKIACMQEKYLENLGIKIKRLRKDKKLTLSALCYKNGLEPSTISRVEKAQVDVKISTLIKIAKALEIKLSDLIEI